MSTPVDPSFYLAKVQPVHIEDQPVQSNIINPSLQLTMNSATLYNGGSGSPPTPTAIDVHINGNTAWINCAAYSVLTVFLQLATLTGGSSPSVTFVMDTQDAFGNAFPVPVTWAAFTTTAQQVFDSIGPGAHVVYFVGTAFRIRWTTAGAPTAATANVTVYGQ